MQLVQYAPNCVGILHNCTVCYFSYTTLVGYCNMVTGVQVRIDSPSNTTSKHMGTMGIKDYPIVTEDELEEMAGK